MQVINSEYILNDIHTRARNIFDKMHSYWLKNDNTFNEVYTHNTRSNHNNEIKYKFHRTNSSDSLTYFTTWIILKADLLSYNIFVFGNINEIIEELNSNINYYTETENEYIWLKYCRPENDLQQTLLDYRIRFQ